MPRSAFSVAPSRNRAPDLGLLFVQIAVLLPRLGPMHFGMPQAWVVDPPSLTERMGLQLSLCLQVSMDIHGAIPWRRGGSSWKYSTLPFAFVCPLLLA